MASSQGFSDQDPGEALREQLEDMEEDLDYLEFVLDEDPEDLDDERGEDDWRETGLIDDLGDDDFLNDDFLAHSVRSRCATGFKMYDGDVYYDPDNNRFLQLRRRHDMQVVMGNGREYYDDARTTTEELILP